MHTRESRPSKLALAMTWCVAALFVVLTIAGIAKYGWSWQVHERFWSDIFGRAHGPMTFRFYLQPFMALIAALPVGIRDGRVGRKPGRDRLREGMIATSRIAMLGFAMDAIYQMKVFDRFYPGESILMVLLLAVLPYFVLRWVVEFVASAWFARKGRIDTRIGK